MSGCSSGTLLSEVTRALYREQFGPPEDVIQTAQLNPSYRYLRIDVTGGPPALLVLGYVDAHPHGDIEVWYSAEKEVIRTQNGRIVGTAGLPLDWLNVRFDRAPSACTASLSARQSMVRVRDEMPSYRFGITDQLTLDVVDAPPTDLPHTLSTEMVKGYTWCRENVASTAASALSASWYAVGSYQGAQLVVYSWQCLSPQFCLSLQRWPPEKDPF